jgi:hypothetical protein
MRRSSSVGIIIWKKAIHKTAYSRRTQEAQVIPMPMYIVAELSNVILYQVFNE